MNKKLLIHNKADNKKGIERKVIYYQGNKFNHLIIFNSFLQHSQVINKLNKHFKLSDNNCFIGLLLVNKICFYNKLEVNYTLKKVVNRLDKVKKLCYIIIEG